MRVRGKETTKAGILGADSAWRWGRASKVGRGINATAAGEHITWQWRRNRMLTPLLG